LTAAARNGELDGPPGCMARLSDHPMCCVITSQVFSAVDQSITISIGFIFRKLIDRPSFDFIRFRLKETGLVQIPQLNLNCGTDETLEMKETGHFFDK
jgi:hypothetical protein